MQVGDALLQVAHRPEIASRREQESTPLRYRGHKTFWMLFEKLFPELAIEKVAADQVWRLTIDLHETRGRRCCDRPAVDPLDVGYRQLKCRLWAQIQTNEIFRFSDAHEIRSVEDEPNVHVAEKFKGSHLEIDLSAVVKPSSELPKRNELFVLLVRPKRFSQHHHEVFGAGIYRLCRLRRGVRQPEEAA